MNKTKIEWCDTTWNPVVGCKHGCDYCYAKRIAARFGGYNRGDGKTTMYNPSRCMVLSQPRTVIRKSGRVVEAPFPFGFEPTFFGYRLNEPRLAKTPQRIFVCSMADLFGSWVPTRWIVEVLDEALVAPQHTYLFLTKNPARYLELNELGLLPRRDNFWYGSTITSDSDPCFYSDRHNCFLSIEPLINRPSRQSDEDLIGIKWVIVGALTGPSSEKRQPEHSWIETIVDVSRQSGVPIFLKNNLQEVWGEPLIQELPESLSSCQSKK